MRFKQFLVESKRKKGDRLIISGRFNVWLRTDDSMLFPTRERSEIEYSHEFGGKTYFISRVGNFTSKLWCAHTSDFNANTMTEKEYNEKFINDLYDPEINESVKKFSEDDLLYSTKEFPISDSDRWQPYWATDQMGQARNHIMLEYWPMLFQEERDGHVYFKIGFTEDADDGFGSTIWSADSKDFYSSVCTAAEYNKQFLDSLYISGDRNEGQ
jgi:hypothetical protein